MGSIDSKAGEYPDLPNDLLGPAEALARFDELVEKGVVKYDYAFVTENHQIKGVDVS